MVTIIMQLSKRVIVIWAREYRIYGRVMGRWILCLNIFLGIRISVTLTNQSSASMFLSKIYS